MLVFSPKQNSLSLLQLHMMTTTAHNTAGRKMRSTTPTNRWSISTVAINPKVKDATNPKKHTQRHKCHRHEQFDCASSSRSMVCTLYG
mmetsp:Transcript_25499/g.40567  ORF Transcript_25499/g.40567 Transcript_25499/m.40567 type:complete len:88 (-) Transcript_25499:416-679(-)